MKVKHKVYVTDDYGVSGILNITGFTLEYIEMMISEYTKERRSNGLKTDIGNFHVWFDEQTKARANGKLLTITYT